MSNSGLDALSVADPIEVSADTMHGHADDARIDAWELKAARRGLQNLKELLYGEPMRQLLAAQVDQADAELKKYLAESDGEYGQTEVIVTADGVTATEFFGILRESLSAVVGPPEQVRDVAVNMVFPMHPEHYALPQYRGVIETMGGIPTRSRVMPMPIEDAPEFVTRFADESYPVRMAGLAELDDGTVFTYVLQQFKDTDTGLQASLRIWYPAACPPVYLEEHAEHYAVEFRNGLRFAAAQHTHTT